MERIEVSKGRVIIEPISEDNITQGGILLAEDNSGTMPGKAKIVRVYLGAREERWLKEGDLVFYDKSNVLNIMHEGRKYLLTNEANIFCKYEKKEGK